MPHLASDPSDREPFLEHRPDRGTIRLRQVYDSPADVVATLALLKFAGVAHYQICPGCLSQLDAGEGGSCLPERGRLLLSSGLAEAVPCPEHRPAVSSNPGPPPGRSPEPG